MHFLECRIEGIGCALALDRLLDITDQGDLCFRPLEPRLESGLDIVWKKYQVFSPAAAAFLEKIKDRFHTGPVKKR